MASVSASHLIIFIASIVIAAGVAGTLTSEVGRLSGAIDDIGVDLSEDIRTDFEIISDEGSEDADGNTAYTASASDGDGNVTLHLKNTGARSLPSDSGTVDVFVDGQYISGVQVTVVDGSEWRIGNVVRLEVDTGDLASGDHRIKIVIGSDEEVFEFRVA